MQTRLIHMLKLEAFYKSDLSWLHQASRHMDLTQLASQGVVLLDLLGAQEGVLRVDWMGFLEKAAPMSGEKSLMNYPLKLAVYWYRDAETQLHLTLEVPVKSLCPASKAMAHSGAHSQRAKIIATVRITQALEFDIQKTLQELERCGSAALFAVLKREDEKYITEEAYAHPKFVEDMVREAASVCHQLPGVAGFMVEVENQESIHNHSVYAKIVHAMKAKP